MSEKSRNDSSYMGEEKMNETELEIKKTLDSRIDNNYIKISKVDIIPYKWYNIIRKRCDEPMFCNNDKPLLKIEVYRENTDNIDIYNNSFIGEIKFPDILYQSGHFCIVCSRFENITGWL